MVREDAQLYNVIPTTPEGAVRNEVVDPATQGEQPLPGLVSKALRNGWATPDEKKPGLVDEMDQVVRNAALDANIRVAAFRALLKGDEVQYARDHPEEAGKAKGAGMAVNVGIVADLTGIFERIDAQVTTTTQVEQSDATAIESQSQATTVQAPGGNGQQGASSNPPV